MAVARYRDHFNRAILIAALARAVDAGIIHDYIVKGGAAIELRFGTLARATRDLDVELPVPLEALRDAFAAALAGGLDDFSFTVRERVRAVREEALRVEVVVRYLGQPWATVDVDLAPAECGDFADPISVANAELPSVSITARTMRTEFLIAQKIHAALTPDEPDYEYGYARHVVDVLFLARSNVDLDSVRAACHVVFELRSSRDGRTWPPQTIALPPRWITEYAATLEQYPDFILQPEEVPAEFTRLLTTLIGGFQSVPGYEYQFNVLQYHKPENPQDAALGSPISRGGIGFEGFANYAKQGWRVRTALEITGRTGSPELLIILERELLEPS
jgi:hypothetical protein